MTRRRRDRVTDSMTRGTTRLNTAARYVLSGVNFETAAFWEAGRIGQELESNLDRFPRRVFFEFLFA